MRTRRIRLERDIACHVDSVVVFAYLYPVSGAVCAFVGLCVKGVRALGGNLQRFGGDFVLLSVEEFVAGSAFEVSFHTGGNAIRGSDLSYFRINVSGCADGEFKLGCRNFFFVCGEEFVSDFAFLMSGNAFFYACRGLFRNIFVLVRVRIDGNNEVCSGNFLAVDKELMAIQAYLMFFRAGGLACSFNLIDRFESVLMSARSIGVIGTSEHGKR